MPSPIMTTFWYGCWRRSSRMAAGLPRLCATACRGSNPASLLGSPLSSSSCHCMRLAMTLRAGTPSSFASGRISSLQQCGLESAGAHSRRRAHGGPIGPALAHLRAMWPRVDRVQGFLSGEVATARPGDCTMPRRRVDGGLFHALLC